MKVYLAGGAGPSQNRPWEADDFFAFYRLPSYTYAKDEDYKGRPDQFRGFILDSGLFSLLRQTRQCVDWNRYVDEYADYVRANNVRQYVEVDADNLIGVEATRLLRRRLEARVGWRSIPVWHLARGYSRWLDMCDEYDYVAFGAFVTDGLSRRDYPLITRFLRDAEARGALVHGLGMTSAEWIHRLPSHSVDSASWMFATIHGQAVRLVRRGRFQRIENIRSQGATKCRSWAALYRHNFYEWVKFSQYAEVAL